MLNVLGCDYCLLCIARGLLATRYVCANLQKICDLHITYTKKRLKLFFVTLLFCAERTLAKVLTWRLFIVKWLGKKEYEHTQKGRLVNPTSLTALLSAIY